MKETGINAFMMIVLRLLMVLIFCVAGYETASILNDSYADIFEATHPNVLLAICIVSFAVFGFMITPVIWWVLKKIGSLFESTLQNVGFKDMSVALLGLLLSLLLANLIAIPFRGVSGIGFYIAVALNIIFAFFGVTACLKKRDEIIALITGLMSRDGGISFRRDKKKQRERETKDTETQTLVDDASASKKVIDSSSLIDGRIIDISTTGFLEGELIIPRFVLTELQGVADSTDAVKRGRGRKGLSAVADLQSNSAFKVTIEDTTLQELNRQKVDEALVELCKKVCAKIITTDFNLIQISKIEGVDVLNINDLANALKPQFLPGDCARIEIIRSGKEKGQGIGYLENGTMLVVEDGEHHIGQTVDVTITSMLQTAAGRMVFGRIKK